MDLVTLVDRRIRVPEEIPGFQIFQPDPGYRIPDPEFLRLFGGRLFGYPNAQGAARDVKPLSKAIPDERLCFARAFAFVHGLP